MTLGADKGYDTCDCVAELRAARVTPHIVQQTRRRHTLDRRTTRHAGYAHSQRCRKRVEEIFGWLKTIGLQCRTRFPGVARVAWMFTFATAVYDLISMRLLLAAGGVPLRSRHVAPHTQRWPEMGEGHRRAPNDPRLAARTPRAPQASQTMNSSAPARA